MMPYPSHFYLEEKSKLEFVSSNATFFIPPPGSLHESYIFLLYSLFCKILRMWLILLTMSHCLTSKLGLAVPLCILLTAGQTCCLLFSQNISFSSFNNLIHFQTWELAFFNSSAQLCSLRGQQDRPAVSVFWIFNKNLEIINTWFGKDTLLPQAFPHPHLF